MKKAYKTNFLLKYVFYPINSFTFFFFDLANTNMTTNTEHQDQWYTTYCGEHRYTLPVRYQDLAPLGHGAFGSVM
jgi:hypothetical protein